MARFLHCSCATVYDEEKEVSAKPGNDADLVDNGGGRRSATTQRAAERAHQTIDRAAELASGAEQSLRAGAARAGETLREGEERALETLDDSVQRVKSYVEKNPLAAAGIAFAAGLLVSALLRR